MAEFIWKQPLGQKQITWKPLTVGQEIEIQMQHARAELAPLRPFENLRARICNYDGKPVCSLAELKEWDPIDLEAFSDEVEQKESARRAAVITNAAKNAPSPVIELEAALMEFRSAASSLNLAADRALAAVKAVPPLEGK